MNSLQHRELVAEDTVGYKVRTSRKSHLSSSWMDESSSTVSRSISLHSSQVEAAAYVADYVGVAWA
jgi:hypothetical protein